MNISTGAAMPPPTRREAVIDQVHGVDIRDDYRWLEDQESPETRAWVKEQNDFTVTQLREWQGHDAVRERLAQLMQVDSIGIPTERNGRYFLSRRVASQQLPVIVMRTSLDGEDITLVDPNAMAPDGSVNAVMLDISRDGRLLIYGIRRGGEDQVEVRVLDIDSGLELPDRMPWGRYYGISLSPDRTRLYYSYNTDDTSRVRCHRMGTEISDDVELFGAGYEPGKIIGVGLSEDGHYLEMTVFHGSAAEKTEVYVKDVWADGPIMTIVNEVTARFSGAIVDHWLYLQTNYEAPNERLLRVDLRNPAGEHWTEIIPTREDAVFQSFSLVGGRLFVTYLENVTSCIRRFSAEGVPEGEIPLPGLGSAGGPNGRWERSESFYGYTSYATPYQIYRYDVETGEQKLWAQLDVPIDGGMFAVEQVYYPSRDGTRIPMFLIYRKGLELDGARPTLITGYGGFNVSLTPGYSSSAALWAENDGIYAVANLRGGGEFGEAWHQAGMRENKQNVFDDFIGAAEWLIANGYTNRERLAIAGGSNGGLLVGAALTQRPDLYRAVVCAVPLLDMVRYHEFLVARYWTPEYGSSEDEAQFRTLLAYSPYHHVKAGAKYPAVLFVTGDSDTRVAPLHARKMAALLQASTSSNLPVLLHYDTQSGHSGGRPLNKSIDDQADTQSFLFWQLGVTPSYSNAENK